jgi:alpha-tubulin suppressor-like RCC1 family protein
LLTTDGRVFSWGSYTPCLGRDYNESKDIENFIDNDIGEVEFASSDKDPIVCIATGRSHVLALDTSGRVYAWGDNQKGQLGVGKKSSKEECKQPQVLRELERKQIC